MAKEKLEKQLTEQAESRKAEMTRLQDRVKELLSQLQAAEKVTTEHKVQLEDMESELGKLQLQSSSLSKKLVSYRLSHYMKHYRRQNVVQQLSLLLIYKCFLFKL